MLTDPPICHEHEQHFDRTGADMSLLTGLFALRGESSQLPTACEVSLGEAAYAFLGRSQSNRTVGRMGRILFTLFGTMAQIIDHMRSLA